MAAYGDGNYAESGYAEAPAAEATGPSGTASLTLTASGGAAATSAGTASLSLTASGGVKALAAGAASLSLTAAGALAAPTPASGAATLALSAAGGASGSPAGTASLNLTAIGVAVPVAPSYRNVPPANLAMTAGTASPLRRVSVPPADLSLSTPTPLIHRAVLLTTRWVFYDPTLNESWTMPINPDSEAASTRTKGLAFARNARSGGRYSTIRQTPAPLEWEFGGVIRTQAHHETLNAWAGRRRIIHVTDHMSRKYEVLLTDYQVTERAPTKSGVRWRLRYSMKALLLRQLA